MKDVGFYCTECNQIHPSCYELDKTLICSKCWCEDVKLITMNNFRSHLNMIPLRKDALNYFKEKYKDDYNFTEKEKKDIINILNKGFRKEKLKKIFKNINNGIT